MSLLMGIKLSMRASFPRPRGDEPTWQTIRRAVAGFSPPVRG